MNSEAIALQVLTRNHADTKKAALAAFSVLPALAG